jgi:hypothetical protein
MRRATNSSKLIAPSNPENGKKKNAASNPEPNEQRCYLSHDFTQLSSAEKGAVYALSVSPDGTGA